MSNINHRLLNKKLAITYWTIDGTPTGNMTIKAPWTPKQVMTLNWNQAMGSTHPYTCANRDDHKTEGILIATSNGWICRECGYTQDWCMYNMATKQMNPPFEKVFRKHKIKDILDGE